MGIDAVNYQKNWDTVYTVRKCAQHTIQSFM